MRKALIPVAVLVFLLSATPAHAYWWDSGGFGPLSQIFDSLLKYYYTGQISKPDFQAPTEKFGNLDTVKNNIQDDAQSASGEQKNDVSPNFVSPSATLGKRLPVDQPGIHLPTQKARPSSTPRPGGATKILRPSGVPENSKGNRTIALSGIIRKILDTYKQRLDQYDSFLAKVVSRRDKLKDQGADVTRLDGFIATARENLQKAQTQFSSSEAVLLNLSLTDEMGPLRQKIQTELTKLRTALTELHKSMSVVVKDIVGSSGRPTDGIKQGRPSVFPTKSMRPSITPVRKIIDRPGI